MKIRYTLVRSLSALIDVIICYIPFLVVFRLMMPSGTKQADLLAQLVFVAYNVICITTFNGQTVGKYFGHLKVDDSRLLTKNIAFTALREVVKILYFTPVIGIPLLVINIVYCLFRGRMFEDLIGSSDVMVKLSKAR